MSENIRALWRDWFLTRRGWIGLCFVGLFVAMSLVYFYPAVLDGYDLYQPDVAGASGIAQDVRDHEARTGERSYWTNSLFGGMPMYQISPSYPSLGVLKGVQDVLTLQAPFNLLPSYSWLLFAMLWGFYLFMRSLRVSRGLSALGAVMWTLSSYFVILIVAGHIWKLTVLAFIPPTIAGLVYAYRGKYLLGGVLTTLFAALQLMSNHVQMSYYFAFVMALLALAYAYEAYKAGRMRSWWIASGVIALSGGLAIAMNASNLYHTYEYTQETMRGGSALAEGESKGLDKDYITAWSYGKMETLTLLVPNAFGGASGRLSDNEQAMRGLHPQLREMFSQINHYWGDQPFTAGPVYVGAFVLFLALLGAFTVRGALKWALVASTILSVALAWGHNLMWLTDIFIDYFPLYNKFRTVSSILVIAEFTIPTLAVLALLKFIGEPEAYISRHKGAILVSLGLTGGVALLLALMPASFLPLLSDKELEMFRPYLTSPEGQMLITALKEVRIGIVQSDAWRSVLVIGLSLVVCFLFYRRVLEQYFMVGLLLLITLVDLWMVDNRYLGAEQFIDTTRIAQQARPVTPIDEAIKQDTDKHYRVLNTSVSTFNDATTSYNHRSVGGYHAAKLSRYQDFIEQLLAKGHQESLNMLDARYIIGSNQGKLAYMHNEEANGAAWLIDLDSLRLVDTPEQEMATLTQLNTKTGAVMMRDQGLTPVANTYAQDSSYQPTKAVRLVDYTPSRVSYEVESDRPRLLVMSEVYYPHGWRMTIDGQEQAIKRVNYILRATLIPEGKHKVELSFEPKSLVLTERIARIAQFILLLGVGLLIYQSVRSSRNQTTTIPKS